MFITEEYLYIIEVFVLHTVFQATQIVNHPVCIANSVEKYNTLEENVYVTKENIAHTTADDYLTQQFELVTDNNVSTVFDPAFISLVSESRSIFYLDELSNHHWPADQSILLLNWYFHFEDETANRPKTQHDIYIIFCIKFVHIARLLNCIFISMCLVKYPKTGTLSVFIWHCNHQRIWCTAFTVLPLHSSKRKRNFM